ncbi:hypothetical protein NDU88_007407 [Pleurodeles waltl]|uniref:Uncharacterized protein n=1 Tax=Pleurodeles waltl TaxID=8319 RepID=A0AAV7QNZ2_PLEWA|nr:hypothetical protein NDU88_007407 [Pleurodeles waltl]
MCPAAVHRLTRSSSPTAGASHPAGRAEPAAALATVQWRGREEQGGEGKSRTWMRSPLYETPPPLQPPHLLPPRTQRRGAQISAVSALPSVHGLVVPRPPSPRGSRPEPAPPSLCTVPHGSLVARQSPVLRCYVWGFEFPSGSAIQDNCRGPESELTA